MKKITSVIILMLMFSLSFCQGKEVSAITNSNNNNFSLVVIYNNFDEMKDAGEQIFYEKDNFSGYLSFQSAYRIDKTKKFKVTYVTSK